MHVWLVLFPAMRLLFAVFAASVVALMAAAIGVARHIRRHAAEQKSQARVAAAADGLSIPPEEQGNP
jgi:hypothetical protein